MLRQYGSTTRIGTILHNYLEINLGVPRRVMGHLNFCFLRTTPSIPLQCQPPMRMTGLGSCLGITRSITSRSQTTPGRKATDAVEVVGRWKSITTLGAETIPLTNTWAVHVPDQFCFTTMISAAIGGIQLFLV